MWGALAPFTERGTTDFDVFLTVLKPYGAWVEAEGKWYYRPFSEEKKFVPMTRGRWVYADFGWYWRSAVPSSWATDHYGYWRLLKDGTWGWMPGTDWHAGGVDWRGTSTHVGWRPSRLSLQEEFLESDEARVAHPEEWIFIPKKKLNGEIHPGDVVTGVAAKALLEDSTPLSHTLITYREIDRVGPDPADFPGAQAPATLRQQAAKQARFQSGQKKKNAESPQADSDQGVAILPYLVMSLPSLETPVPDTAEVNQIYCYRPKLYQDSDGIQRRITIWNRPQEKVNALEKVNRVLHTDDAKK